LGFSSTAFPEATTRFNAHTFLNATGSRYAGSTATSEMDAAGRAIAEWKNTSTHISR